MFMEVKEEKKEKSVKKEKVKENEKIKTPKKKNLIFAICAVVAIVVLAVVSIIITNSNIDDTYKIAKKISDELKSDYDNITFVEEKEDTKDEYSYVSSTLIYIDSIGSKEDEKFAVAVAKYNSNAEALKKEEFYNSYNKLAHEKFDNTVVELSDDFDSVFMNNVILVKGKYLFSINPKVKNQAELIKNIEKIVKDYDISDISKVDENALNKYWEKKLKEYSDNIDSSYNEIVEKAKSTILEYVDELEGCTGDTCDKLLNEVVELEKYTELSEEITKVKNKYNEIIKAKEEVVNSINSTLSEVKRNLNQEQYDSVKKRISELTDTYYDKYKDDWNSQLASIEESVYKNSCGRYSYKDLLRNPSDYKGKKAYFFGQILQKVGSTQYRVGVDCSKYNYIAGYHCDNTIYVTYYGDASLIEDDMVELWGTMDGTQTYTTVMGASVTIPKLYAKYATLK